MKILLINWQDIKTPQGGGAEVHAHEIFKRIAAMGHEVVQFSCKFDDNIPEEEIIDGIKIIRKGSRNTFNFIVRKMYKKRFSKENFDIIIDDINKIPFYSPCWVKEPLLAISHHFFGKSIFREAGFIAGSYVYLSEKIIDWVYKKTPFAVVSESTLSEFVQRGFDRNNFAIVPNAIDESRFSYSIGEKEELPTVSYFGRLKKYKSPDHLLYAFAKVKKSVPNAKLQILGRGDFRPYMEELAKKLGIEDDTKFFGFVSEEDKVKLLSRSHVVVNTSMKEGWGITNIEANACGTPVISANVPGLRDSVKQGVSGTLYEYANIDELAKQIIELLQNQDYRMKLSNGAIEWAKSFSWEDSTKLMLEKMEKTIREKK